MRRRTALQSAIAILIANWAVGGAAADIASKSLDAIDADAWTADKAAHLLRRAAFGGTPTEVERFVELGLDAAVDYLVDYHKTPFEIAPPPFPDEVGDRIDRERLRRMTEEQRRAILRERRRQNRVAGEELRLWWFDRMASTPRPLEERMTLFWHGLLTSGMREVRRADFMRDQNELLRRFAVGNYRELIKAIGRDRAMLVYLDGARNRKEQPNENYARELMELFTLGEGRYSERDIKEAARAFTGWGYDDDGFVFRERMHDNGAKQFLGRKGRFDGDDIVDIILDQPEASRHLARKLLIAFVRPDPEPGLVNALSREIRRNKWELVPVLKTLFTSQAFYHDEARASLVKSPIELIVGAARALGVKIVAVRRAERAAAALGQELLQPPNVKGWDGGAAWINTATLYNRYNTVTRLITGFGADRGSDAGGMMSMATLAIGEPDNDEAIRASDLPPRSRMEVDSQPAFDPMPYIRASGLRTAQQVVDAFAHHLLAAPLDSYKRELLIAYLNGDEKMGEFSSRHKRAADRVRTMLTLMVSTPEFQMQ